MTIIERGEGWTGEICDGPDCPHYGKRAMMVCFDRAHWKSIGLVRRADAEGAVERAEKAEALARKLWAIWGEEAERLHPGEWESSESLRTGR